MKKRITIIKTVVAWIFTGIVLIPLFVLFLSSLKTTTEASQMNLALPTEIHFENYILAIETGKLVQAFFNSMLISLCPATVSVLTASMGAYIMQRNKTKINKIFYNYIFFGLMAPINYVATVMFYNQLSIINTFLGIILLYTAAGIPFAVFICYGFMSSVPKELDEAAIVDGANLFQTYFKIIFPLLKSVTVTAFILNFMGAWNDFVSPLYLLNSQKKWPMLMRVYNFYGLYFNEWNMICAVILLSILPVLIVYILGQKYIVSGMTSGAVKM